jgi:hypothetical protein
MFCVSAFRKFHVCRKFFDKCEFAYSDFISGITGYFPVQHYIATAVEFCAISFIILYLFADGTRYNYLHTKLCWISNCYIALLCATLSEDIFRRSQFLDW